MDYEKMWNELKTKIQNDLEYYKDGTQCSLMEMAHGTVACNTMLKEIEELEEKYKNT